MVSVAAIAFNAWSILSKLSPAANIHVAWSTVSGADPEKIIQGGGYWNSTIVAESEEQSGHPSQVVIAKLKVRLHVLSSAE